VLRLGRSRRAQPPGVGFLRVTSAADSAHLVAAFRQGLKEAWLLEDQNVVIEYRNALKREGIATRLETLRNLLPVTVAQANLGP
jgi:hypothetical protein